MTAYMVVYATVTDPAKFKAYAAEALPLMEAWGAQRIALGAPVLLEGERVWKGSAIYLWPSRESALGFWKSEEYAQVKRLREAAAEIHVAVIDGHPK